MEKGPLTELLVERFEAMPRQVQVAARFVLDHPHDVALMSMREQAQRAGVSHTTMMRLARWVGLNRYEDLRDAYAEVLRAPDFSPGGSVRAEVRDGGDGGFSRIGAAADVLAAQVARLGEYANAAQFIAAAKVMLAGRNLFSLGMRNEHPVAQHFAHILSRLGGKVALLDAAGGLGIDALRGAGGDDALLAVSLTPYSRATIEIAQEAARQGVAVVAITDSSVSPLARIARETIIVTDSSQSFFSSVVPALAAVEILAALLADKRGEDVGETIKEVEQQLAKLNVYWKPAR